MNDTISPDFEKKFVSFVGKVGVIVSLFLIPPLFTRFLSVSELILDENRNLWIFSIILFFVSLCLIIFPKKIKTSYSFLFFVFLFFITIELFTRVYVIASFDIKEKEELGMYGNKTYENYSRYKGHPFLAYTGNPSIEYGDLGNDKKRSPFNNQGFVGKDFNKLKQKNTIRVACLGGSTTERGYPAITEYQLNKFFGDSLIFEVLNYGVSGWTSANTLVNFILNVRSFNPDYVLIHHGWNESKIRNTPEELFRDDYSHALTYFHEPEIIDKTPIRVSLLYRILKKKYSYTPDWMFLGDATTKKNRPQTERNYNRLEELNPFKRNIKTIIDLCLIDSVKVLLSTQPFSLKKNDHSSKTIYQANDIMRELALVYKEEVLFLDLDDATTGNFNDIFTDLAHMNSIGNFYKGSEFARVIINDITEDSIAPVFPYKRKNISFHSYVKEVSSNYENNSELKKRVVEEGGSLHDLLKKDIYKEISTEKEKNITFDYLFQEYKIRSNANTMETIRKKASEVDVSLDEVIEKDVNDLLKKVN